MNSVFISYFKVLRSNVSSGYIREIDFRSSLMLVLISSLRMFDGANTDFSVAFSRFEMLVKGEDVMEF
jgi:hypothetical protein